MKKLKKLFTVKRIVILIIIVVVAWVGISIFKNGNDTEYILEEVAYNNVIREVSETGMVKVSEQADLGFKYSGKIDQIYVSVGDQVTAGQSLAKLDTTQLYIELSEAQANLDVAEADYNSLLAGSSAEEIQIAETNVTNAQTNLDDVKADADEDLNQAYEDALDELDDAYLDIYNALIAVEALETSYFTSSDQESITIRNSIKTIRNARDQAESYIDEVKVDSSDRDKINTALSQTKDALSDVRLVLADVRSVTESSSYSVSSADKTTINNQRTYVNTAHEDIVGTIQNISSTKITNSTNVNTAEATLASAENTLALKQAGPTQEAINVYLAKIDQAKARVSLLNNKIGEATLRSPADGQVIEVNKRRGETAQVTDAVIGFLSAGPFQVEVDIYEEDVVGIQVDNTVRIELPAFPDEEFSGKVISVDPAEKLIDGIVYYEVNISFEISGQNIKPGMTADVIIETAKKDNVLSVPASAVEKDGRKRTVKIYQDKNAVVKEIEIGLEGEDYTEVISGVIQGDQVIIGEKQK